MTPEELAQAADVTVDQVVEWRTLGLLTEEADGSLAPDSLPRARLLCFASRRGLRPQDVARAAAAQGDLLARYLLFLGEPPGRARTMQQAAEELDLDVDEVRELSVAGGFGDETRLFDEDVEMLRGLVAAREAGLPDEALLQVVRVFGDALSRVADAEVRLFHFYVHEQLRASGLSDDEVSEATTRSGEVLLGLVEPAILYFHRKAWERSLREDVLLHLAEDVGSVSDAVGELTVAVLFVDLAGYTGLTEAMGDDAAARVLDRFSDLTRRSASENDGRVVKQIGDEFMLVFPDAAAAVRCGVDLAARASTEHEFPGLRMGAHAGAVLYREGDYLGSTVNVAARATALAGPGAFVVTGAVRQGAAAEGSLRWTPMGAQQLKGMQEPTELYRVASREARSGHVVDAVCGMRLDPQKSVVSWTWDGADVLFCSQECQGRFAADPERYPVSAFDAT